MKGGEKERKKGEEKNQPRPGLTADFLLDRPVFKPLSHNFNDIFNANLNSIIPHQKCHIQNS